MLRVIRNHRRAAYNAPRDEYEGLTVTPVGIDAATCPPTTCSRPPARPGTGRSSWASSTASATRRSRSSRRPARSAWSWTATRPASSRTSPSSSSRSSPAAATSRSSTSRPAGARTPRLHAAADRRHRRATAVGRGTLEGCPHINHDRLAGQGLHRRASWTGSKRALPSAFDIEFAFNRWTLGEEFCTTRSASTEEQLDDPSFNMLDRARLHAGADRRRQRLSSAAP